MRDSTPKLDASGKRELNAVHGRCGLPILFGRPSAELLCGEGQAIKTQSGVSLFEETRQFETVEPLRQFRFHAVFDDHEPARRDHMRCVEEFENLEVFFGLLVWWIEKNEIGEEAPLRNFLQSGERVSLHHFHISIDSERLQIFTNEPRGCRVRLDKNGLACTAADRFDSDCSRPRIQIDEERVFHRWPEDIEQSFTQTIARGPHSQFARGLEPPAPKFTADYAHT